MQDIPLYLFAKAPVAGKAKKRMCPPLTYDQAAQVAAGLLQHAGQTVEDSWPGQCVLSATPDLSHSAFSHFQFSKRWQTVVQVKTDLGGRMGSALQAGIDRVGCAAVLGTDIPGIDAYILQQAHALIAAGNQVVGPSADGGFYFLGLHEMPERLFENIQWGARDVYSRLLHNVQLSNIELITLPRLSDCDFYEDLRQAAATVPEFSDALVRARFDLTLLK